MGEFSRKDYISHLPQSIIETILAKVPTRDAVRTSILSKKWRYQWATMTQLVLDEEYMGFSGYRNVSKNKILRFIVRYFLLHDGPIHKFKISTLYSISSTEMDTWLLFLSRKDIKELLLEVWQSRNYWNSQSRNFWNFRTPSCIFSCQKLTRLKLYRFKVEPPLGFQGFPCLKYLNLFGGEVTIEVIENLITGCPLLEKFKFSNGDNLALTVCSPNLKHLTVRGIFKYIYLEHTPSLVHLILDFTSLQWEDSVPVRVPVTHNCLKVISLREINFEEMKQVSYVRQLLLQSPNLQELHILAGDFKCLNHQNAAGMDFWEREFPTDFTFKHLKIVNMDYSCSRIDIAFLIFVLGRSPVLEKMCIKLESFDDISDAELSRLQQASANIQLHLFD
ncbi:F-box/FBD/LRR-repeat protein At1g13570-like [Daucus carota subsp. sativus]|uniref:F-box/FBD/LRR-repeat protein At1g13570-like n=1 Tax=Daucus carota subsp. sativus TaxID=79200 RepID=UPI003082F2FE